MIDHSLFSATVKQCLLVVLATQLLHASPASAQSVLLSGPSAQVTNFDLTAAALRIPQASRTSVMSKPQNVARQAEDIYVRRALAGDAEKAGLDRDPVIQAQLRQARERILSDAQLAEIERRAKHPEDTAKRLALEAYRTNPARYETPAQTRARHILIVRAEDGKARQRAQDLLDQIRKGASFEALAREHSGDHATAGKGGDLGYFAAGSMVKAFESAVAELKKPGDLSGIVETEFGFHIVQLIDRRAAGRRSFDEVQVDAEREVQARAQAQARQARVDALIQETQQDVQAIDNFVRQQTGKP